MISTTSSQSFKPLYSNKAITPFPLPAMPIMPSITSLLTFGPEMLRCIKNIFSTHKEGDRFGRIDASLHLAGITAGIAAAVSIVASGLSFFKNIRYTPFVNAILTFLLMPVSLLEGLLELLALQRIQNIEKSINLSLIRKINTIQETKNAEKALKRLSLLPQTQIEALAGKETSDVLVKRVQAVLWKYRNKGVELKRGRTVANSTNLQWIKGHLLAGMFEQIETQYLIPSIVRRKNLGRALSVSLVQKLDREGFAHHCRLRANAPHYTAFLQSIQKTDLFVRDINQQIRKQKWVHYLGLIARLLSLCSAILCFFCPVAGLTLAFVAFATALARYITVKIFLPYREKNQ